RERFPLAQARHFDLLHPARRLWKARLESCRLQSLERALLGVIRRGDVPGEEIPRIYFDFVRRRDGRAMARVLEHNRLDVLSLAALAALACQWVEGGHAEDPRDVYCLARVLERASLFERSEEQYRRLLDQAPGPVRTASLLRLAARAKKAGQMETAVAYWEEAAQSGDWFALRELALHHEHRSRDLPAALSAVENGLGRLDGEHGPGTRRAIEDFHRRRQRLLAKLSRRHRPSVG
ncbi:MAG TPA: ribonuclease H-like domain-containing protein, partial [Vicinamibacteria bacterium]|nr:ribonuclease H-like domain-containing protein [Vicinamibacteria bacterium]